MRNSIAAAVFRDSDHAERAIHELREAGVPDSAISVIRMHDGTAEERDGAGHRTEVHDTGDNKGTGALKGLATGGVLGAIAGLGALAIPGIGPFIAGGALAQTLGAAGSAAVVSGAVGAAAGGLTGALVDYGLDRGHAEYYEREVRGGGTFVAVDTAEDPAAYSAARAVLRAAGGQTADTEAASNA
jgi:hypothetical protein